MPSRAWSDLAPVPAGQGEWIAPLLGRWGSVGCIVGETWDAYAVLPHRVQESGASAHRVDHDDQLDDVATAQLRDALEPDPVDYRGALWEGYGSLGGGSSLIDGAWRRDPAVLPAAVMTARRLELPHRGFHVFDAELTDLAPMPVAPGSLWTHVPNLFWPLSRTWLFGFDVDVHASFVGGPASLVQRVLLGVDGAQETTPDVMLGTFPGW